MHPGRPNCGLSTAAFRWRPSSCRWPRGPGRHELLAGQSISLPRLPATPPLALGLRLRDPSPDALRDNLALVLGKTSQDGPQEAPRGGTRVHTVPHRDGPDASGLWIVEKPQRLDRRAAEMVKPPQRAGVLARAWIQSRPRSIGYRMRPRRAAPGRASRDPVAVLWRSRSACHPVILPGDASPSDRQRGAPVAVVWAFRCNPRLHAELSLHA